MTETMRSGWDLDADVVVVGAGGAGLMAALAAADQEAVVIVLEKADTVGGKSGIAIGSFTASETDMQRAAGIMDSHADHLSDMAALADRAGISLDLDRARLRIAEDARTFAQFVELGVDFSGPHPEAPHRVPRMHNIVPGPRALIDLLHRTCEARGVEFLTGHPATALMRGPEGGIDGVETVTDGQRVRIYARAVIFCSGDYIANHAMLRRHAPDVTLGEPILPTHTGDGHEMALEAGGQATHMDRVGVPQIRTTEWPHLEPSPGLYELGAVLIDHAGNRQEPVTTDPDVSTDDLYLIIDDDVAGSLATPADDSGPARDGWQRTGRPFIGTAPDVAYAYLEDCFERLWYARVDTPNQIAQHVGCSTDAVASLLGPDRGAPFHLIGPMRRYLISVGGALSTNIEMSVTDEASKPIPGLYAAGDTAAWMEYAGGHGYGISWAATSGRLAGAAAGVYARGKN